MDLDYGLSIEQTSTNDCQLLVPPNVSYSAKHSNKSFHRFNYSEMSNSSANISVVLLESQNHAGSAIVQTPILSELLIQPLPQYTLLPGKGIKFRIQSLEISQTIAYTGA